MHRKDWLARVEARENKAKKQRGEGIDTTLTEKLDSQGASTRVKPCPNPECGIPTAKVSGCAWLSTLWCLALTWSSSRAFAPKHRLCVVQACTSRAASATSRGAGSAGSGAPRCTTCLSATTPAPRGGVLSPKTTLYVVTGGYSGVIHVSEWLCVARVCLVIHRTMTVTSRTTLSATTTTVTLNGLPPNKSMQLCVALRCVALRVVVVTRRC